MRAALTRQRGSRSQSWPATPARWLFGVSAVWLLAVAGLWVATVKTVPVVNVRWVPRITGTERVEAEMTLSLVLFEPKEPGTASYFLPDADTSVLKQIVIHPLVEDTAFINRGSFVLDNAPSQQMWIGDRFRALRLLLYLGVCGFAGSALVLLTL